MSPDSRPVSLRVGGWRARLRGKCRVVMATEEAGGLTTRRGWAWSSLLLLICSHKLRVSSPAGGVVRGNG